ncbi:MAG: aminopeptidase P family protein [Rhodobacteraceae bacterium]|nr:MAG: aminopeptidase P family protein [Paracoccaceae bacterium]
MIFETAEYDARMHRLRAEMARRKLDGLLLFAPESHFWATGYDTFGYCFFQTLVVTENALVLLTRSADLRQAELTSTIRDVRLWRDGQGADPTESLPGLLSELKLSGKRIGVETDTHGLTAMNGARLNARLSDKATLVEASDLVPGLRLVKSEAEIVHVRRAAELGDAAWEAALPLIRPGAEEGEILAALQGAVFEGGGGYPANEFILGSGEKALLCRYQSERRTLDEQDQLTLEWAGVSARYHAALMRTVVIGPPRPEHLHMHAAALDALLACEAALKPGRPMGEVFSAHAHALDHAGFGHARLNACGYSLGARFTPSWMDPQMFYDGADTIMGPGMVFFLHMILMDSRSGAAMTLGRTSLVTETGAEPLSRLPLELPRV